MSARCCAGQVSETGCRAGCQSRERAARRARVQETPWAGRDAGEAREATPPATSPGFPAGGASLAGVENSIGSRDVSPPELRVSAAALLPLHCLWEEPEEKRGVGQDLLPRSEYNSSQSRQRALASPSLERGLCSRENVWKPDSQTPGHKSGRREGSTLLPGFTGRTRPNPDCARAFAPSLAIHLAGTCFVILLVKFSLSKL